MFLLGSTFDSIVFCTVFYEILTINVILLFQVEITCFSEIFLCCSAVSIEPRGCFGIAAFC